MPAGLELPLSWDAATNVAWPWRKRPLAGLLLLPLLLLPLLLEMAVPGGHPIWTLGGTFKCLAHQNAQEKGVQVEAGRPLLGKECQRRARQA